MIQKFSKCQKKKVRGLVKKWPPKIQKSINKKFLSIILGPHSASKKKKPLKNSARFHRLLVQRKKFFVIAKRPNV